MATVPATRTWVAGEVVTAAHFNTNIRDVFNYLLAPPILKLVQTVAQSIPNAAATAATFSTEIVDSSGMHSTSVNTSRATAVYPGWYDSGGKGGFSSDATGLRIVEWAINATVQNGSGVLHTANATTSSRVPAVADKYFLNVGEYQEISLFQNRGSALNTVVGTGEATSFNMTWVSN